MKTNFGLLFEWPLKTGFTVLAYLFFSRNNDEPKYERLPNDSEDDTVDYKMRFKEEQQAKEDALRELQKERGKHRSLQNQYESLLVEYEKEKKTKESVTER